MVVRRAGKVEWSKHIDKLQGSDDAKRRMHWMLQTLGGQASISEACQDLEIGEARFHALRNRVLQDWLSDLEPRRVGRPARRVSELETTIDAIKAESRAAQLERLLAETRLEVSQILRPMAVPPTAENSLSKKNALGAHDVGILPYLIVPLDYQPLSPADGARIEKLLAPETWECGLDWGSDVFTHADEKVLATETWQCGAPTDGTMEWTTTDAIPTETFVFATIIVDWSRFDDQRVTCWTLGDLHQAARNYVATRTYAALFRENEGKRSFCRQEAGPRGPERQRAIRELEREAQGHAVLALKIADSLGVGQAEVSSRLGVPLRTLTRWADTLGKKWGLESRTRGRPCVSAPSDEREKVLAYLNEHGPETGVRRLKREFPQVPRSEIEDILFDYREEHQPDLPGPPQRLNWALPGAVLAIDFKVPPDLVDARFSAVFHVRDQATGYSLAWTATENETSVPVLRILRELFAKYGAPLVIKCDNGSAFINEEMKAFLQEMGVHQYFSPPRKPSYNGGVERGNGIQGAATRHQAKRNGRDGYWMTADLNARAGQRHASNERRQSGIGMGPSGEWEARRPIEEATRQAFQATFAEEQRLARQEFKFTPDEVLGHHSQATVDRVAGRRAMLKHGLYSVSPRRAKPLPISQKDLAIIT